MKKIFLRMLVLSMLCLIMLTSCSSLIKTNEVINNVTNEITETTTTYKDLSIETLEEALQVAVAKVEDAVIGVTLKRVVISTDLGYLTTYEDKESVGSAVIYKRENVYDGDSLVNYRYYAYTNAHVITGSTTADYVAYAYLDKYNVEVKATILGSDTKLDLACICFETYHYIDPVEVADSDELTKGTFVFAIGNPDGYDYYGSATFGIISNLGRYISFDTDDDGVNDYVGEYIQTDAAINPGNSGGGLFTLDGKLVGINSIKITSEKIDNMGFAIPSSIVKYAIDNYLEEGKTIERARFGVTCIAVRDMTSSLMINYGLVSFPDIYDGEQAYGIYVTALSSSGSLVGSSISAGDILLKINGEKLYSNNDITGRLNSFGDYTIGSTVEITYYDASSETIETINIILTAGN